MRTKSREGGGRAANRLALSVSHTLASSPKGGARVGQCKKNDFHVTKMN